MVLKTVTVFIDPPAKLDFAKYSATPKEVLEKIMEIFSSGNSLSFGYDLNNLKILDWRQSFIKSNAIISINYGYGARYAAAIQSFLDDEAAQFFKGETNVGIFFSGKVPYGCGCTPDPLNPKGNGNGIMLIGTRGLYVGFPNGYITKLARVGAHEQAHLFGIDHSTDWKSIMYKYTNSVLKFDRNSLKILKEKII